MVGSDVVVIAKRAEETLAVLVDCCFLAESPASLEQPVCRIARIMNSDAQQICLAVVVDN